MTEFDRLLLDQDLAFSYVPGIVGLYANADMPLASDSLYSRIMPVIQLDLSLDCSISKILSRVRAKAEENVDNLIDNGVKSTRGKVDKHANSLERELQALNVDMTTNISDSVLEDVDKFLHFRGWLNFDEYTSAGTLAHIIDKEYYFVAVNRVYFRGHTLDDIDISDIDITLSDE